MTDTPAQPNFHIAILDVEASAFGPGSYPIEVGVAVIRGTAQPIRTWSALIRPSQDWIANGVWSPASAEIHHIPREVLEREGHAAQDVCDQLNAMLGPVRLIVSDAPLHDQDWLNTLFRAGDRDQLFSLEDFDALTGGLNHTQYRRMMDLFSKSPAPHRAGDDALRLASSLLEAWLGHPPPISRWSADDALA